MDGSNREIAEEIVDDGPNTFGKVERAHYIVEIESALDEAYQRGREKGLEEAAEVAENHHDDCCEIKAAGCSYGIKSEILSLKTSGKEGAK